MAEGLALAQQGGSSWTKRSLIHRLAAALPDRFVLPPGADADVFLTGLADRVIVGAAGEQVVCLSAPEYPRVPDSLRRADGESVYHAHGSELYATAAQMSLEDRVVAMAQAPGAPRLAPDVCAKLLGAAEPELEAQLRAAAPGSGSVTGSGLRLDQAAAAFHALTSPRRTEVIVAAAGAGKTYTAGVMARAWAASGTGRVFGVATSSAARNELADAGVPDCYNFAQFLGHTKERREALRKVDIGAGDLILVDEGTMASLPDFDALQRYATARGAAVRMFAGDQQLGAVEGVSAAGLLARSGQYARLQEPVRFAPGWERDASLALKDGDVSCLQAYEDHGRLHGGTYEEMAEQAARMYMADMAEDVETSLNAYSHAEVQDLNRRVQAYMREYRLAGRGPSVQLRDGTRAAAGELVLARENDNRTSADGDRTVSNGDILRVYEIRGGRVTVRRLTGHDKQTGRRTWSDPYALTAKYLREHAELGYAQTTHTAEGATTWSGILLTSNTRTRTSLYPGLTRGRHRNHAFAYPAEPDCEAGKESQAAPEVARYQAMAAERDGAVRMAGESEHDPVVLLAPVISRDDTDLGATEIRQKALADADHMATLWQIRQDLARRSSAARYEAVVRERFSADQAAEIIADTDDLWRALRGAELAGVTPSDALSAAVAQRSMGDAESVPAVLTYRVRKLTEHLTPADPRRQPEGDGEAGECMRLVDTLLDGRQERIAEHTAKIAPGWAVAALGPVPETEEDRREWEAAAGVLGGYREIRTFDSPVSAIGPRPPTTEPEMRAEWHKAHAVITHAEEMRLRDLTEGQLLARRTAGLRDTTWAPPEVTREMGVAHSTETEYRIAAAHHLLRSRAPLGAGAAAIARAGRHLAAAQEAQAAAARCQDVAQVLAAAHATRQQYNALHAPGWAEATEADRELHRRGLLAPGDVLRSQERPAFDYAAQRASAAQVETGQPVQGELDLGGQAATPPAKAEAAVPSADDVRVMLGIDPARVLDGGTDALEQMKAATAAAQEKIDREATILEPDAQDEDLTPAQAWSRETGRERQSVLHTPDPEMPVAPQIAAAAVERDREATS